MTVPVELILEGVQSARKFTLVAPVSLWAIFAVAIYKGAWWVALPVGIFAAIISLPHALAHLLAARLIWRERDAKPSAREEDSTSR